MNEQIPVPTPVLGHAPASVPTGTPVRPKVHAKPKAAAPKPKAKPAVKKAKPKAVDGDRLIPANIEEYTKAKTAAGNSSLHCGDEVAGKLAGRTLDEAYALAAKATGQTVKDLQKKYGHLNVGMQRMNLGNKIRGALAAARTKKAEK